MIWSFLGFFFELNKSIVQHNMPNSAMTGMTQRLDCEREIITCSLDGRLLFWDIDVNEPVGCFHETQTKFTCCAISPNGRFLAACTDEGLLFVYDLADSQKIQDHEGHSGSINEVMWSPDMRQIITVGADCAMAVWNFFE